MFEETYNNLILEIDKIQIMYTLTEHRLTNTFGVNEHVVRNILLLNVLEMYLWVSYGTFRKRAHHLVRKRQNQSKRHKKGGGFLREGVVTYHHCCVPGALYQG